MIALRLMALEEANGSRITPYNPGRREFDYPIPAARFFLAYLIVLEGPASISYYLQCGPILDKYNW
jgi:hypothetical protein